MRNELDSTRFRNLEVSSSATVPNFDRAIRDAEKQDGDQDLSDLGLRKPRTSRRGQYSNKTQIEHFQNLHTKNANRLSYNSQTLPSLEGLYTVSAEYHSDQTASTLDRTNIKSGRGASILENGSLEGGKSNGGSSWTDRDGNKSITGTLDGWKSASGKIEIWDNGFLGHSTVDGGNFIELDVHKGQVDSIYQDVSTTDGTEYELTFLVRQRQSGSNDTVSVYWDGELVGTYEPNSNEDWTEISVAVTGSGTSQRLTLSENPSQDDSYGVLLDNISLTPIGGNRAAPNPNEEDNKMAISSESTGLEASDSNQEALEARFIALYETLMEKQVSFKEAVEPFKTDNQNAGKG